MEKSLLENCLSRCLSTYQISKELNSSQTNIRYWLRKYGLNTKYISNQTNCKVCNTILKGNQTQFCSKRCSKKTYSTNPNNYILQQKRAHQRKDELINLKGGKCEICGYASNKAALCFHHKDSKDKLFTLDARHLSNTNKQSILIEAEKCQLLCLNCHAELHNPSLKMVRQVGLEPTKGFHPHPPL